MKFSINRKNRDRRGGHKVSQLIVSNKCFWVDANNITEKQRHFIKHTSRKELRRHHKKATEAAMLEFYQDSEDSASLHDLDLGYLSEYEEIQDYEDYCNHRLDEDYYDDPGPYEMGYDDYFDDPWHYVGYDDPQETYGRNRIITENDLGMALGELIEKYIN